jgi:hypothetical protein
MPISTHLEPHKKYEAQILLQYIFKRFFVLFHVNLQFHIAVIIAPMPAGKVKQNNYWVTRGRPEQHVIVSTRHCFMNLYWAPDSNIYSENI